MTICSSVKMEKAIFYLDVRKGFTILRECDGEGGHARIRVCKDPSVCSKELKWIQNTNLKGFFAFTISEIHNCDMDRMQRTMKSIRMGYFRV